MHGYKSEYGCTRAEQQNGTKERREMCYSIGDIGVPPGGTRSKLSTAIQCAHSDDLLEARTKIEWVAEADMAIASVPEDLARFES